MAVFNGYNLMFATLPFLLISICSPLLSSSSLQSSCVLATPSIIPTQEELEAVQTRVP